MPAPPTLVRPTELWKRMSKERRQVAAHAFWQDDEAVEQQVEAIEQIARQMKFRPKSVLNLPLDRKTRYLASMSAPSETIAARALVSYHLAAQRDMMAAFLGHLGIANDNGLITEEDVKPPDEATLLTAAEDLVSRFPREDVTLYFSTLVAQDPETWGLSRSAALSGDTKADASS